MAAPTCVANYGLVAANSHCCPSCGCGQSHEREGEGGEADGIRGVSSLGSTEIRHGSGGAADSWSLREA